MSAASGFTSEGTFMQDAVKKKSKLESEKELAALSSKKRNFTQFSNENKENHDANSTQSKQRKFNDGVSSKDGKGFMDDVIIKKSKIELEKEAAQQARTKERESLLKTINSKGIFVKVDLPIDKNNMRPSRSPRSQSL